MKKEYETAELEVVVFASEDIITDSGEEDDTTIKP